MSIVATINQTKQPQITVQVAPTGALQPTGSTVVLKNTIADVTRLDQLKDVVEPDNPGDNSVLVYHPETDKYVVQQLNLDGGIF